MIAGANVASGTPLNGTSGKRGKRYRFRLSNLPKCGGWITREVNDLRRDLEAAVTEKHGAVGLLRDAVINRICRCERSVRLLEQSGRAKWSTLTLPDQISLQQTVTRLTADRDKGINELDIGTEADPLPQWPTLPDVPDDVASTSTESTTPSEDLGAPANPSGGSDAADATLDVLAGAQDGGPADG